MKNITTMGLPLVRRLMLILMLASSFTGFAQTIRNLQTACPYDTTRLPCTVTGLTGCNLPNYQFRHQQDCCGAIRLCTDTNTVYGQFGGNPANRINAAICGKGCKPAEISGSNSCLSSSENQTSWYQFEVRPLVGGGKNAGDFAGFLRMKIIPCDVPPNRSSCETDNNCNCDIVSAATPAVFNDNGNNNIGSTDYDWILYEVTHFPRGTDLTAACPLISNAPIITGNRPLNRPWIRRCNYTGLSGPTGLYDPNSTPGIGDSTRGTLGGRFLDPLAVYVGQRFILAVDNFASTTLGYKIDFTGRGNRFKVPPRFGVPDPWPSATVVPPSGAIKLDTTIDVSTCADNVIRVRFNRPIPSDSLRVGSFKIVNPNVPPVTITGIRPEPNDVVLGFARRYIINTTQLYSSTTYQLIQNFPITDPCGNQDQLDTTNFIVKPFTYFDTIRMVCQNPYTPPRYGNGTNVLTIRSKISKSVLFNNADYRYQWKVFAGMSGTDSIFVPIPTVGGNDSMRVLPPILTNDVNTRLGPALIYTPTVSSRTFRVPIRLVSLINTGVCNDSARGMITVNAVPDFGPDSINVCFGDPVRVEILPIDTIGRVFTWRSSLRRNWAPVGGVLNYLGDTLAYDVVNAQVFDRRSGCTYFTKPFRVETAQRYFPNFSIDTLSFTLNTYPMRIRLNNLTKRQSVDNSLIPIKTRGLAFRWDMGNGDKFVTRGRDTALYTYLSPRAQTAGRQYSINLEVYDTLAFKPTPNCIVARTELPIVVYNPLMPNVITPSNMDGANDNLYITGISKVAKLRLYNRYGVLMYSVDGYKNDFTASNYAAGTYYYIVDDQLTGIKQTGWLEVLR